MRSGAGRHETDELYRDQGLPSSLRQRSAASAAAARNRGNHAKLRRDVGQLMALYRNAYSGDFVLSTIARNVLTDALARLR